MDDETHYHILNKIINQLIFIKKSGTVETVLTVPGVALLQYALMKIYY